jgi:hypothetical protein
MASMSCKIAGLCPGEYSHVCDVAVLDLAQANVQDFVQWDADGLLTLHKH